jgi:uncharacterized membrane protein
MADVAQQLKDKVSPDGSGEEDGRSRLSGLAGKGVLVPAVATAATAAAAGLAAKKGPDLLKKLQGEAGRKGAEGVKRGLASSGPAVGKAASKLVGGGQKGGKTRRLPIQRWTDVAVPVDKAYQAWTQFEEFPKFMHRVLDVKKEDTNKIHWREKIWFSTREWDGEITERRKNDRIAWKSVKGTQHSGVISFHKLDTNLTRVLVTVDFVPSGMIEKLASGLRFAKRAVEADLARFKAYVELGDARGLEYKSTPAEMEQHREDGDDDSEEDDRDRGSEREERAGRREERRKSLSST